MLDVLDIPLVKHKPHDCQTENWVLDDTLYWKRDRQVGWKELLGYAESPKTLWTNDQSTYHGQNDEIERASADKLPNSLCVIRVPSVELRVFVPGADFGDPKRKVRGAFTFQGEVAPPVWTVFRIS